MTYPASSSTYSSTASDARRQAGERFYSRAGLLDGFSSYFIHAPRNQTTAVLLANIFPGRASIHQIDRKHLIDAPVSG